MRRTLRFLAILGFSLYLVPQTQAIIFLPALLVIPIAKIVAVIIAGLSIPAIGIGAVGSMLFGTSRRKTISLIIIGLVIITMVIVVILKVNNPARPLF